MMRAHAICPNSRVGTDQRAVRVSGVRYAACELYLFMDKKFWNG